MSPVLDIDLEYTVSSFPLRQCNRAQLSTCVQLYQILQEPFSLASHSFLSPWPSHPPSALHSQRPSDSHSLAITSFQCKGILLGNPVNSLGMDLYCCQNSREYVTPSHSGACRIGIHMCNFTRTSTSRKGTEPTFGIATVLPRPLFHQRARRLLLCRPLVLIWRSHVHSMN